MVAWVVIGAYMYGVTERAGEVGCMINSGGLLWICGLRSSPDRKHDILPTRAREEKNAGTT